VKNAKTDCSAVLYATFVGWERKKCYNAIRYCILDGPGWYSDALAIADALSYAMRDGSNDSFTPL
jgi:hypothetical protein